MVGNRKWDGRGFKGINNTTTRRGDKMIETYQLIIICFACFFMGMIAGGLLADWSFFHYPGYWIKEVKKSEKFRNFCVFGYFYKIVKTLNKRRS